MLLYMWLKNNTHVHDFLFVPPSRRNENDDMSIVFGNIEEYEQYNSFIIKTGSWFPSQLESYTGEWDDWFPKLPKSGTHTLSFVMANPSVYNGNSFSIELIEVWTWIVDNCNNPVYMNNNTFAFTSEDEAIKFKMFKG